MQMISALWMLMLLSVARAQTSIPTPSPTSIGPTTFTPTTLDESETGKPTFSAGTSTFDTMSPSFVVPILIADEEGDEVEVVGTPVDENSTGVMTVPAVDNSTVMTAVDAEVDVTDAPSPTSMGTTTMTPTTPSPTSNDPTTFAPTSLDETETGKPTFSESTSTFDTMSPSFVAPILIADEEGGEVEVVGTPADENNTDVMTAVDDEGDDTEDTQGSEPPSTPSLAECSRNDQCTKQGLTGQCCPTIDDWTLTCCGGEIEESCVENPQCDALGLTGACCPTTDNKWLDCCAVVPDKCINPTNETDASDVCERYSAEEYLMEVQGSSSRQNGLTLLLAFASAAIVLLQVV